MGTEPPADKKESPSVEQNDGQTEERGSRYKGYKGGQKRFTKKKVGNKEVTISKSKFKGALDALVDYYFDTGPTQAHDFKNTRKKISIYIYRYQVFCRSDDVNRGCEGTQLDGNDAKKTNQVRLRHISRRSKHQSDNSTSRTSRSI
jgi:hypothetical protein